MPIYQYKAVDAARTERHDEAGSEKEAGKRIREKGSSPQGTIRERR